MEIKHPKTYEEQIAILHSRGCVIDDTLFATEFLKRVNYYRFTGYLSNFKNHDNTYLNGTTFLKVASLYSFDQDLRGIIIKAVSEVENFTKSIIAYHHGHKYGTAGYMDVFNFNEKHNHERFMEKVDTLIENNKRTLFVKHHIRKYSGSFPIWVAIELFTMGMISIFYSSLKTDIKKIIAKEYNTDYAHLESWLNGTSTLRNICAHHGRLYNIRFYQSPKLPREYAKYADMNKRSLFKQLYMLKLLYSNWQAEWNNSIIAPLSALVEKHEKHLDIKVMGFPENWEDALVWK